MSTRKIYYMFYSGKNSNFRYYLCSYLREMIPTCFWQMLLKKSLSLLEKRADRTEILNRVNYYNKLTNDSLIDKLQWDLQSIEIKHQPMTPQSVYYHDSMKYARYFKKDMKWILLPGDITHVPELPSIVKSRPLGDDNQNSILLNMDKVRHFLFVDDKKAWRDKRNAAIFRGDLGPRKENRNIFMRQFACNTSPLVDAASTNLWPEHPEWQQEKMTIGEHLGYKFVMSLEGNDVASNLKWVMSSNSIAVSPRLTCETWFMEGTLIPNYHYIEVKDDFSDLEERLTYYIEHPSEAEAIIQHAHEYVNQFRDKQRERLVSLLVLMKYFDITNK